MQIVCEAHPQIGGRSQGLQLVLYQPEVLEEPVIQGDSDADGMGASIYGSVLRDQGLFRMWYQAWPRDWDGSDVVAVGCAESDDGIHWRRPNYGLVEVCGSRENHLTNLPFHSPSVFVDPHSGGDGRYRAFGYTEPRKLKDRYTQQIDARGYYTAHSADGIHWRLESSQPVWPHADVITSVWDPHAGCARIALKHNGVAAGLFRRRFFMAEWARGRASAPVSALFPDELDDMHARQRGFISADYYGVGLMPTEGPTIGFLWNFRHLQPLGHGVDESMFYGNQGQVDLSIVYQLERGGRWLHVTGRPDWLNAAAMPAWARGALYTAASPLQLDDETWLYFTGSRHSHGWCGAGEERKDWRRWLVQEGSVSQIGLAKWPRDRIMGYRAVLPERVELRARVGERGRLALNVATGSAGHIRVELVDGKDEVHPGYSFADCDPVDGDHLEAVVRWRGQSDLPAVAQGEDLIARVEMAEGTLYAFDFVAAPA